MNTMYSKKFRLKPNPEAKIHQFFEEWSSLPTTKAILDQLLEEIDQKHSKGISSATGENVLSYNSKLSHTSQNFYKSFRNNVVTLVKEKLKQKVEDIIESKHYKPEGKAEITAAGKLRGTDIKGSEEFVSPGVDASSPPFISPLVMHNNEIKETESDIQPPVHSLESESQSSEVEFDVQVQENYNEDFRNIHPQLPKTREAISEARDDYDIMGDCLRGPSEVKYYDLPKIVKVPKRLNREKFNGLVIRVFQKYGNNKHLLNFNSSGWTYLVKQVCLLPLYWKKPLFVSISNEESTIDSTSFLNYWHKLIENCHDHATMFIYILSGGKQQYIEGSHLRILIQDVIDNHPDLHQIRNLPNFHNSYYNFVIAMIFYFNNHLWSFKITASFLRSGCRMDSRCLFNSEKSSKSKKSHTCYSLLQAIQDLENCNINDIMIFSYLLYYLLYSKFCQMIEIDNINGYGTPESLYNFIINEPSLHIITTEILLRIFFGVVSISSIRSSNAINYMSFGDFIWFYISMLDKSQSTAIEYWFRCLDVDGIGHLTVPAMTHFVARQNDEFFEFDEYPKVEDLLEELIDMIHPENPNRLTLMCLKKCRYVNVVLTLLLFYPQCDMELQLNQQYSSFKLSDHTSRRSVSSVPDDDAILISKFEAIIENQIENICNEDTSE